MGNKVDYGEIKPCPFCGKMPEITHSAVWYNGIEHNADWAVECINVDCPVRPKTNSTCSARWAVSAWNERSD